MQPKTETRFGASARKACADEVKFVSELQKTKTLTDLASIRMQNREVDAIIEGESLPGWERPRDWFDTADRSGFTDERS